MKDEGITFKVDTNKILSDRIKIEVLHTTDINGIDGYIPYGEVIETLPSKEYEYIVTEKGAYKFKVTNILNGKQSKNSYELGPATGFKVMG